MTAPSVKATAIASEVIHDLSRSWRKLAVTDIAWKVVAFALLTPATALLLRWLMSRAEGADVVADLDIATFFLTTPMGVVTLILGAALIVSIVALEMACLMAIGLAAANGVLLTVRDALLFALTRAGLVLRLTANMALRLLVMLAPFLLVAGTVYWFLLRTYDINYYLAARPPAFWVAAAVAAMLVIGLAVLLVRTIAAWALALPLVLFEEVLPRRALAESADRTAGLRAVVIGLLVSWAACALLLLGIAGFVPEAIGRSLAPHVAGSLPVLLAFITGLTLLWSGLVLVAGVINVSLFALTVLRLYLHAGNPSNRLVPEFASGRGPVRVPRFVVAGAAAVVLLAVLGFVLLSVAIARRSQPVLVIAHRGSSATAPENTLAAFRLAAEQNADFVEFDVQESADGEVIVMHDSDLMRVGRSALKVWEANASDLRAIDIGSYRAPQFSTERVPTLADTLAACKGRLRVVVELKSYGHDQRLEEKVVSIVEEAGMVDDAIFMSLNHDMVRKIKELRPSWRAGVLVAKAVGDLTSLRADFLAVEARIATRPFVRQAHRAGQDVYVWTLNDPAWMLSALGNGVDGIITDVPDLARVVVESRNGMTDAQRILTALLIRLGVRTERLEAEDALRP